MSAAVSLNLPRALSAPAKLNLCLFVGPTREDGLHEICSFFVPLTLADRIVVSEAGDSGGDSVRCPVISGPNLVETALDALREAGWQAPPLTIEIEKRIPIAAGLGGGSADAAALLRLARGEVDGLAGIAAELGADVPSQIEPQPLLVTGAGEIFEPVPRPGKPGIIAVPILPGLSAGEVYAEADRLGSARSAAELIELGDRLREVLAQGRSPLEYPELLVNDLEPAARSLRPEIDDALTALAEAGAEHTMVTGSGPTAIGIFADVAVAQNAVAVLPPRYSGALVASPAVEPTR